MAARRLRPGPGRDGCRGPAILDTAAPLYNPHYLNELGSPRFPDLRKFTGMLNGKRRNALSVPVGGGGSPICTQNAYCSVLGRGQNQSSGQPARLDDPHAILLRTTAGDAAVRSALKVLESAKYPTIQFRHITGRHQSTAAGRRMLPAAARLRHHPDCRSLREACFVGPRGSTNRRRWVRT